MPEVHWEPNRAAALARLQRFVPLAGRHYQAQRNQDTGRGHSHVSGLSPYLRRRLLTETEVLAAVLAEHSSNDAFKFIQELFWRTYWKGWLEHRPAIWEAYCSELEPLLAATTGSSESAQRYRNAIAAATGIAPFDTWVRELQDTGYLHNHARMWFASIWVFTLELPWQLGADFFLRYLLDGDPASNTLSWRWVAGLHTRGKTYLARSDNIQRYAGQRFSAAELETLSRLTKQATALQESQPLPPARAPLLPPATVAGAPPCGLLLTQDDCASDTPLTISAVAALTPGACSTLPAADCVARFDRSTLSDAVVNAQRAHGLPRQAATAPMDVAGLVTWAQAQELRTLCVAYVPVGPNRTPLAELEQQLARQGIALQRFTRSYDRLCWPHASAGFFRLGKQIPKLIAELGVRPPGQRNPDDEAH